MRKISAAGCERCGLPEFSLLQDYTTQNEPEDCCQCNQSRLDETDGSQHCLSFFSADLNLQQIPKDEINNLTTITLTNEFLDFGESFQRKTPRKKQTLFTADSKCQLHFKAADIVCISELKRICSDCALFGPHKNHTFKSLEQVREEANNIQSRITEITQCQKVTPSFIQESNIFHLFEDLRQEWTDKTDRKEQETRKQINTQFDYLVLMVNRARTNALVQLKQSACSCKEALSELIINFEDNTERESVVLQEHSNKLLGAIARDDQSEILRMLYQSKELSDVVKTSMAFMKLQQLNNKKLTKNAESILNNLTVVFVEGSITKNLSSFCNFKNQKDFSTTFQEKNNYYFTERTSSKSIDINMFHVAASSKSITSPAHICSTPFIRNQTLPPSTQPSMQSSQASRKVDYSSPLRAQRRQISPKALDRSFLSSCSNNKAKKVLRPTDIFTPLRSHPKFSKVLASIENGSAEAIDLTAADIGDEGIKLLTPLISKCGILKNLKLPRNRLTDNCLDQLLTSLGSIEVLNLSNNNFSATVVSKLIDYRGHLKNLKSVVLSCNKIAQRKSRLLIEELRSHNIVVSL